MRLGEEESGEIISLACLPDGRFNIILGLAIPGCPYRGEF